MAANGSFLGLRGKPAHVKGGFLAHVAETCERAAKGDLEARVLGVPEDGDLRRIGTAINDLLDVSDAYVRESTAAMDHCGRGLFHRPILERGLPGSYAGAAATINGAAAKMKDDAEELKAFEAQRAQLSNDVSEAAGAVAAACEELNATTGEIKAQLGTAVSMTHRAVEDSERSIETIRHLGEAARQIEAVVSLIARIARHTNLLALNATIEAARAGTHGAGFAVVANEVKVLSQDTAKATGDISRTVEEMLKATTLATVAITAIGASVKDVDASASSILLSLEEQVKATGEISVRINAVADQTRELNQHAA